MRCREGVLDLTKENEGTRALVLELVEGPSWLAVEVHANKNHGEGCW